jgi:hypothetical protein
MSKRRRNSHKRRRRSSHRRRARINPTRFAMNAPRRRRRSGRRSYRRLARRRNPGFSGLGTTERLVPLIVGGAGGFFGARLIPQNVPFLQSYNTGVTGYALNAVSGGVVSWLLGFWKRDAMIGGFVGTALAVISRVITDQNATNSAMSGDLDFDMGYYVSDRYPFPQGNGGPYPRFPGTPFLANPPFGGATAASAVTAGQAAAAAALPAAAAGSAMHGASRWGASRWG